MPKIGFPIPMKENESRRALLPGDLYLVTHVKDLVFESGYGQVVGYDDEAYRRIGATVTDRRTVCECPIICNCKLMLTDEYFRPGRLLFGWIHAVQGRQITDLLVKNKMTAIAWEEMFENGRHCFWHNNEIAGEAAVLHAFIKWGRLAYKSVVAVIGCGNVARGAIRTLERLGCNVTVYDRKTVHLISKEIGRYDVVVNAVLWNVFNEYHLIYEEDLAKMKPGAMIVDISCDDGLCIESSRPTTIDEPVYLHLGIFHYAVDHTPSLFYKSASESISKVVARFIDDLIKEKSNHVLDQATIIRDGIILDQRINRFQHRT